MPTVAERVSVVEVQVANLDEKIDEIKTDVKELGVGINQRLDTMYDASCTQHAELAHKLSNTHTELDGKIGDLEKLKNKWTMYIMILLAFGAGTGWAGHLNMPVILKFLGL
jgi:hypothetical protein